MVSVLFEDELYLPIGLWDSGGFFFLINSVNPLLCQHTADDLSVDHKMRWLLKGMYVLRFDS